MSEIAVKRDIEIITGEIIGLREQAQQIAAHYSVEIGRRLTEAKSVLPHGEWGDWLKNRMEFSQQSANNFMRIYERFGNGQLNMFSSNSQPVSNLTYTQLVALLVLPEDECDKFIKENDVENMSKRELEKAVKERKEAIERAEAAEEKAALYESEKAKAERYEKDATMASQRASELNGAVKKLNDELENAKVKEREAKEKLKKLKDNPQIPQEVIDKAKADADERAAAEAAVQLEKSTAEIKAKLEAAEEAKRKAELAAENAAERVKELETKIKMQNPEVERFKSLFETAQKNVDEMFAQIDRIKRENAELAEKFTAAAFAFLNRYRSGADN